jgi:toxin HigB-1
LEIDLIRSFSDTATEDLYHGRQTSRVRRFPPTIISVALRKLDVLAAAHELVDLRMPPGNHLEALKGDLEGFHSIRINDQWRIVFRWENGGADQVAIKDYH